MVRFFCPDAAIATRHEAATAAGGLVRTPALSPKRRRQQVPFLPPPRPNGAWTSRLARLADRRRLRADIVRQLPRAPGEQALAVVCDIAGAWIVATDRGLYRHADAAWRRIGWEQVARVDWDGTRLMLRLTVVSSDHLERTRLHLPMRSPLVELVRERVASTLLFGTKVRIGGSIGALVNARRRPGSDEVVWQVVLDPRLDLTDPTVQSEVAAITDRLRGSVVE